MRSRLVPPLVFAALVLALCWRIWLPIDGGHRCFSWDALWSYWGDVALQIDAVRSGELPLWNPFDRLGFPYFADPQNGTLYPPQWPLVALGLVTGATWWLVAIKVMLHLWWFGLGMYVWLRRRDLPRLACYAAGVFVMLSYPITHGLFSALNWGVAWAPWLVLAVEAWAARPQASRGATLALVMGMTWLVGAPASFWYALLVAAPIGVWALVQAFCAAPDRRAYTRAAAASAALAAGLFVVMVAGQMLATSALLPHTVRAARDLSFITESVLFGDNLFGMLVPRLPGLEMYYGMVGIFAALVAVTVRPTGRTYLLAAIALGGMLLAFGSHGGWLPSVASALPPAGLFRRAHRYVFVTMVPFAALAAEGLALLARLDTPAARRGAGRLLLVLGGVGVVIFGAGLAGGAPRGKIRDAFVLAIVAWAAAALLLRQLAAQVSPRARSAWLAAAVVWWGVELYAGRQPQIDANFWPAPTTEHDADVRALPGVPLAARVYDREYLKYRPGARLAIRDLGGYEGDPLALRRYSRFMAHALADPHVLGHANVAYVLGTKGAAAMKLPADFRVLGRDVWVPPDVAPAVVWYGAGRVTVVDGEEAALRALRGLAPGTGVVLERPVELAAAPPVAPVAGRLTRFGLNHLGAEIDAPAEGVVVVAEAYHPGWRATVDGAPAEIFAANGAFRGVRVGPGRHVITMRYSGGTAPLAMALSVAAMLAAAVLALRRRG